MIKDRSIAQRLIWIGMLALICGVVAAGIMTNLTLRSIEKKQPKQVRLKKKTLMYYSLTLELTDLQTGLIEWSDSKEIVRESSKPFIGW